MQPVEEEKKIIQGCLDREPYAWDQFVDCYAPVVLGALQSLAREGAPADLDVDAATMAVFRSLQQNDYELLRQFRFESSFRTYMIVLAQQTVIEMRSGA